MEEKEFLEQLNTKLGTLNRDYAWVLNLVNKAIRLQEYQKSYYGNNKEKLDSYHKTYRQQHPEYRKRVSQKSMEYKKNVLQ